MFPLIYMCPTRGPIGASAREARTRTHGIAAPGTVTPDPTGVDSLSPARHIETTSFAAGAAMLPIAVRVDLLNRRAESIAGQKEKHRRSTAEVIRGILEENRKSFDTQRDAAMRRKYIDRGMQTIADNFTGMGPRPRRWTQLKDCTAWSQDSTHNSL